METKSETELREVLAQRGATNVLLVSQQQNSQMNPQAVAPRETLFRQQALSSHKGIVEMSANNRNERRRCLVQ